MACRSNDEIFGHWEEVDLRKKLTMNFGMVESISIQLYVFL